jgi:cell wall-associated NlpC family hydrolase
MSTDPWREMTGKRRKSARLIIAAVFVLPLIVVTSGTSFAGHATQADVQNAQDRIDQLNVQLEAVVEQYNQARNKLQDAQTHLAASKKAMDRAKAAELAAQAELGKRAVQAYTGMGSQVDVLLGAQDFTQFSDRLEFMGALAQNDADLATAAATARQKAEWATEQYNGAVTAAQAEVTAVNDHRDQFLSLLDQAQTLYAQTSQDYRRGLAEQRAAAAAQAQQDNSGNTNTGTPPSGGTPPPTGGGSPPPAPPPPVGQGAAAAIDAAKAVLGAPYVFGTAGPSTFDCSGLTMWAWAHGGVSLPHSSASQAVAAPEVSTSALQPGDLLFFYSPISHVALYIGGGYMIHARHPGPGGEVQIGSVSGYGTPVVKAVRP